MLIAARTVQGWAGGLVAGSGMALITSLFDPRLRTRIIAISQGTFTACHLSGPIVGGMFAAMYARAVHYREMARPAHRRRADRSPKLWGDAEHSEQIMPVGTDPGAQRSEARQHLFTPPAEIIAPLGLFSP